RHPLGLTDGLVRQVAQNATVEARILGREDGPHLLQLLAQGSVRGRSHARAHGMLLAVSRQFPPPAPVADEGVPAYALSALDALQQKAQIPFADLEKCRDR